MKVGLYFGSFNPIHVGHLIIASFLVDNTDLEKVWFVVSPQNPLKKSSTLLNEYHRLHLVKTAIEGDEKLGASDIEFKLSKPSYTCDTLVFLQEKYPSTKFILIIGSDSYQNISKWKNSSWILENFSVLVYPRPNFKVDSKDESVQVVNAPLLDISSTLVRELIHQNKSFKYLVSEAVYKEIKENNYYKKTKH